jgi:hypothetical protein
MVAFFITNVNRFLPGKRSMLFYQYLYRNIAI